MIDLELRVTMKNARRPVPWTQFLQMSGNPLIPTFGEAMDHALSPEEITEFTAHLKPLVETGVGQERMALAYLTALKE